MIVKIASGLGGIGLDDMILTWRAPTGFEGDFIVANLGPYSTSS